MGTTQVHHHHEDRERNAHQLAMEKERNEHAREMARLEQMDKEAKRKAIKDNIGRVSARLKGLDADIKVDQASTKEASQKAALFNKGKEKLVKDIADFPQKMKNEIHDLEIKEKYEERSNAYERDLEAVSGAIQTTGQHDENVEKFLTLTHSLIGATMNTEAETNKLDVALSTFSSILNDECQDKLTIESYFNDKGLSDLIPILHKNGYSTLDHLECYDDKSFEEDIVGLLEKGLKAIRSPSTDKDMEEKKEADLELEGEELCQDVLNKWKLSQYWDKLLEEGWDDAYDWTDLTEEDLIEDIEIEKKGHRKKFMKNAKAFKEPKQEDKATEEALLQRREMLQLKAICMNPDASWKPFANEKTKEIKDGLLVISGLMGVFFGKMNDAVKQSNELLNYDRQLTERQHRAIGMKSKNMEKLQAIEYKKTDHDIRRNWTSHSKCRIYSESSKQWLNGKIASIDRDDEGEWLTVKYGDEHKQIKQIGRYSDDIEPFNKERMEEKEVAVMNTGKNQNKIKNECSSLIVASVVSIRVTNSMIVEFTKTQLTDRAYTLALGVEDACERTIRSQGEIRQSVFLAQEILKYKPPPNLLRNETTASLWNAIDKGIIQIFSSALEMVKVSSQYFGFFLRFKNSFQYFQTCYRNNADVSMLVSLERLKRDLREFKAFKDTFSKSIVSLNKTAMDCIQECVETHIGAEQWKKSRESLNTTEAQYIQVMKKLAYKRKELENELNKIKQHLVREEAAAAEWNYQETMLKKRIQGNEEFKKECKDALVKLQSIVV